MSLCLFPFFLLKFSIASTARQKQFTCTNSKRISGGLGDCWQWTPTTTTSTTTILRSELGENRSRHPSSVCGGRSWLAVFLQLFAEITCLLIWQMCNFPWHGSQARNCWLSARAPSKLPTKNKMVRKPCHVVALDFKCGYSSVKFLLLDWKCQPHAEKLVLPPEPTYN